MVVVVALALALHGSRGRDDENIRSDILFDDEMKGGWSKGL